VSRTALVGEDVLMASVAVPAPSDVAAVQRRVLVVTATTQVLAGVGVATVIAASALIATRLSGSETVGGAAATAPVVGAAVVASLLAAVAGRSGRRPALALGYGIGAVGGVAAVLAVAAGSAIGLVLALVLVGSASAAGLSARYGATDLAPATSRARSLALVVWAATVGSVAGPNLAPPVERLAGALGLLPETGPYLLCVVTFAAAAAAYLLFLRPDPLVLARIVANPAATTATRATAAEAVAALLASPAALLGLAGVAIGHLAMVGLMSMTPVHMDHGGATLTLVGVVVSLHIAGMYGLSPLFGWLADAWGRVPVLVLAGVLIVAAALVAGAAGPTDVAQLSVGLVLLGLGWSAAIVAGSALLSESVPMRVRTAAQGVSDVAMNVAGAVGGLGAGLVVAVGSYAVLGIVVAVLGGVYLLAAGTRLVVRTATSAGS
jgi:MFS family permease